MTRHHLTITIASALIGLLGLTTAPVAVADPDCAALPVDPNVITDSTAYLAQPAQLDPDGVIGIQQAFDHRDGSREIVDTILATGSPQAAVAALEDFRTSSTPVVAQPKTTSAPVGENGTLTTGTSPDGSQSVAVLLFTRGGTATEIQFRGAASDPVPANLVIDYGQRQDDAIARLTP